jgi:hypothetical protein
MVSGYPPTPPRLAPGLRVVQRPFEPEALAAECGPWAGVRSGSTEALRPATALPVPLGGGDSTSSDGLSVPGPAVVISQPTSAGAGTGSGVARLASFALT